MKVTQDITSRFMRAYSDCPKEEWLEAVDECLTYALANVPEPVPAIEPLTPDERFELEDCRHMHKCGVAVADGKLDALLRITERRFPKPAPKTRTAEELANIIRNGGPGDFEDALAALVARASRSGDK